MRTADTELFKDKIEVSLDGRQIFYLFFGGAIIASLVFVLGVMVGKRVEARAHLEASAATNAALDPLAALDQLSVDEQRPALTFPAALTEGHDLEEVDAELTAAARQRAASEQALAAVSDRGADEAAAAEPEHPAPAPAAAKPVSAPVKPAATPAKPALIAPAREAPAAEAKFTLQLSSFQDRGEADAFVAEMKQAGWRVYMVEAEVQDKGTWYRVRLGHYASYDDALRGKERFEDQQHVIAYVTRVR